MTSAQESFIEEFAVQHSVGCLRRRVVEQIIGESFQLDEEDHPTFVFEASHVEGKKKKMGVFFVTVHHMCFVENPPGEPFTWISKRVGSSITKDRRSTDQISIKDNKGSTHVFEFGGYEGSDVSQLKTVLSRDTDIYAVKPEQTQIAHNSNVGCLTILAKKAQNLAAKDANGYSDPFCKLALMFGSSSSNAEADAQSKRQTDYVQKALAPVFNERCSWVLDGVSPVGIRMRVYDYDTANPPDFIGEALLPFTNEEGPNDACVLLDSHRSTGFGSKWRRKRGLLKRSPVAGKTPQQVYAARTAEAAQSQVGQKLHVNLNYQRTAGFPCQLLSTKPLPGALFCMEDRLMFLTEDNLKVWQLMWTDIVEVNYCKGDSSIVVASEDAHYLFAGFSDTRDAYQTLSEKASQSIGQPTPAAFVTAVGPPKKKMAVDIGAAISGNTFSAGCLQLQLVEGRNLVGKDKVKKGEKKTSDPYCRITMIDVKGAAIPELEQRSRKVVKSTMPMWDENFDVQTTNQHTGILIQVYDWDAGHDKGHDFMGQCVIDCDELDPEKNSAITEEGVLDTWFKLESRPGKFDRVAGKIHVVTQFKPGSQPRKPLRELGIGKYAVNRRHSVTELDFENHQTYAIYPARYKGADVAVWCGSNRVSVVGQTIVDSFSFAWSEVDSLSLIPADQCDGQPHQVDLMVRGHSHLLYIPKPGVLENLQAARVRYMQQVNRPSLYRYADPEISLSWWETHPYLTLWLHGALLGLWTPVSVMLWLLLSLYFCAHLIVDISVASRAIVTLWLLLVFAWLVEHIEFTLDWENLVLMSDLDEVIEDFQMMMFRRPSPLTQFLLFAYGGTVVFLSLFVDAYFLASVSAAFLLTLVASHLKAAPGEQRLANK